MKQRHLTRDNIVLVKTNVEKLPFGSVDLINWKQVKSATLRFLLASDVLSVQNLLPHLHEVIPLYQLAEGAN